MFVMHVDWAFLSHRLPIALWTSPDLVDTKNRRV